MSRHPPSSDAASKRLTVGRGITLSGEIRACDLLIVEGQVEATLSESRAVEISASGVFKGIADIESAEVSGLIEGELVVRNTLVIHSTGRVLGKISYGRIEIARGGVISGQIDVLPEASIPTQHRRSEVEIDGAAGDTPDRGRFFDPGAGRRENRPKGLTRGADKTARSGRDRDAPLFAYITIPPSARRSRPSGALQPSWPRSYRPTTRSCRHRASHQPDGR